MTVLVSACLLGVPCRYDGQSKRHPLAQELCRRHQVIPVCGEIFGGLPTPRPPAEICGQRVVTREGADVTAAYRRGAEAVLELARLLTVYCGRMIVHIIPFTEIQEEIRRKCPEDHFTLIMRRFMMRLADMLAQELRCRALVTGENLGQVASQTMQALAVSEDVTTMPVLRPLIGMDKEEIVKIARHIGTIDTSILPYEDCCTVFTPRHPRLRPTVEGAEAAEAGLDIEAMVQAAVDGIERIRL